MKKNHVAPAKIPALISIVHDSLIALGKPIEPDTPRTPAVPIHRSVTPNSVVCLDCGWSGNMPRRHLQTEHGLTPDQYRAKWGLRSEHSLTAPAYSERRSALASSLG